MTGGPSLLARLSDGRFLIGLPGNPLAAMMGMLTLAQPVLAGLAEVDGVLVSPPPGAHIGETAQMLALPW